VKKQIGKLLSILIPLAIGLALVYYKFNSLTSDQIIKIKDCFNRANYSYIYLSLFIALFGFWSRAYRWKFSIEQLGYKTHFHNNLFAVCISYLVNLTIPRSGEISRALILKKYENIPFDKAFGTIVAERVVDFILFLVFVMITFFIEFDVLKEFVLTHIPIGKLIYILIFCSLIFIAFVLIWVYSNWKIITTLKDKLEGLIEGMTSILKMKKKWAFLFHSVFIWITYLLMFYITIFALKETEGISFGAVIAGFVFGSLAIGFTNGGFGAYPFLIAEIFMLYNVPDEAGTAFGWLVWTSQTVLMILLGGLSFLLLPLLNKK
jgi:glycosyltransferase 2 family protein